MFWKKYSNTIFLIIIFFLAAIFRLTIAIFNTQSNDDHTEPIAIILEEKRLPLPDECWECFQPELFYITSAILLKMLGIENPENGRYVIQLMNASAGILTLLIVFLFLKKLRLTRKVLVTTFALVALNPKLLTINSQITNDSFVIFFSICATYSFALFLEKKKFLHFSSATIFAILAAITKGVGLVFFFLFPTVLVCLIVSRKTPVHQKKPLIFKTAFFLIAFLLIVPFAGGYYQKYKLYGSPFVVNIDILPELQNRKPGEFPHRPGVIGLSSYLTFPFFSLLKFPYNNSFPPFFKHQQSLWSQLYGRAYSINFQGYPPLWIATDEFTLSLSRIILFLAIFPTFILLYGLWENIKNIWKDAVSLFFSSLVIFYLLFVITYSAIYRDFTTMKVIFIFPALLGFVKFFADGYQKLISKIQRASQNLSQTILITLILLFILDTSRFTLHLIENIGN